MNRKRSNHQPSITLRELQVLQLAAEGLTYKEIAATLAITTGTVKKHLQHIYKKLKAGNKIEAIVKMHWLQLIAGSIMAKTVEAISYGLSGFW